MYKTFFSVFRSLIRAQTNFKNKNCLKVLKNSFFGEKMPAFSFKKYRGSGTDLPHNDVTLLDIVPGMLCFAISRSKLTVESLANSQLSVSPSGPSIEGVEVL